MTGDLPHVRNLPDDKGEGQVEARTDFRRNSS